MLRPKINRRLFLFIIIASISLSMCSNENNANSVSIELQQDTVKNTSKYSFIFLNNGKKAGKRIFEKGEIVFLDGDLPNGVTITTYDNNKVKAICVMRNWKRNGPAFSFYPSGKLKVIANYQDGHPTGYNKTYYENGNLLMESEIKDGQEQFHKEYGSITKTVGT